MNEKILKIFLNALPIIFMVVLIPFVKNDYLLTIIYLATVAISLYIKYESKDLLIFVLGFFIMLVSEYFFLVAGVEKFNRHTLFGIMPLWLPFLWAYSFVAIKRTIKILNI